MTPFTTTLTFDGIPLDLSGKRDAEDCWLTTVCVAGTPYDLFDKLAEGEIERLAELADAHLAREAAEERAHAAWAKYQQRREEAYDRCPA